MRMTAFVERKERKGPTWSQATNRFEVGDDANMTVAFQKAGLDYRIEKEPMAFQHRGKWLRDDQSFRLVREAKGDTPATLIGGVVGPKYGVLQNMAIARMFDPITEFWKIATVGEFDFGMRVYGMVNAGRTSIGGDEITDYFMIADGRDGGTALEILYTPVRAVCENTFRMALKKATTRVRLMHTLDIEAQAELFVKLMAELRVAQEDGREVLNKMVAAPVDGDDIKRFVEMAFPMPQPGTRLSAFQTVQGRASTQDLSKEEVARRFNQWKAIEAHNAKNGGKSVDEMTKELQSRQDRVKAVREQTYTIYKRELEDHKISGDSLYHALNAGIEVVDWGGFSLDDNEDARNARAAQTMFGKRAEIKDGMMRAAEKIANRALATVH